MFTQWIENFGASITVMDLDGKILDMNASAGKVAGLVEISLVIPNDMPHFDRG